MRYLPDDPLCLYSIWEVSASDHSSGDSRWSKLGDSICRNSDKRNNSYSEPKPMLISDVYSHIETDHMIEAQLTVYVSMVTRYQPAQRVCTGSVPSRSTKRQSHWTTHPKQNTLSLERAAAFKAFNCIESTEAKRGNTSTIFFIFSSSCSIASLDRC